MLAVKMLWHMDTLSQPCFLITLRAASPFSIESHLKNRLSERKKKNIASPASSYDHDADSLPVPLNTFTQPVTFFPYAQTCGLWQTDEQNSFIFSYTHVLWAGVTHLM